MTQRAAPPRLTLEPLIAEGVSPWLDGLRREQLASRELARLITGTGVRGAVLDTAALATSIARDHTYARQLTCLARRQVPPDDAVRAVAAQDARWACDEFRAVYETTRGLDGLVSVDLNSRLAHDTASTVREAVTVSRQVNRPNALVSVPATPEGLMAVSECLAQGIGVHVTGVFSPERYRAVFHAYMEGLERALSAGLPLSSISSVASLPTGHLDTEVDARLGAVGTEAARRLRGEAAVASARLLYRSHDEEHGCPRWGALAAAGARPQRLMWISTVTDPDPHDVGVRYMKRLVTWGSAHALPAAALHTASPHRELRGDTLLGQHRAAQDILGRLEQSGIAFQEVISKLEAESAERNAVAWQNLYASVEARLDTADGTAA